MDAADQLPAVESIAIQVRARINFTPRINETPRTTPVLRSVDDDRGRSNAIYNFSSDVRFIAPSSSSFPRDFHSARKVACTAHYRDSTCVHSTRLSFISTFYKRHICYETYMMLISHRHRQPPVVISTRVSRSKRTNETNASIFWPLRGVNLKTRKTTSPL